MGAHFLAIKDMAGVCRPYAAYQLVKALKEEIGIPDPFSHARHQRRGAGLGAGGERRAGGHCGSGAGLDVRFHQPAESELHCRGAATRPRDTGLDLAALNEFSDYWEQVAHVLCAVRHLAASPARRKFICTKCRAANTPTSRNRPRAWAWRNRWPEIARTYAEVNQLFGDIVKVTPSSKVVGDMTMFLITRGIKPADVLNLEPGATPFPESVIDMLAGGLGQPVGGWPKKLQKVVLGKRKPIKRPARANRCRR